MASLARRRVFGILYRTRLQTSCMNYSSGGDKDHDYSGSIRESGGAFGKKEKAEEARYFSKLQTEQLKKLKSEIHDEIKHHEDQIKHHQDVLNRHKKRLQEVSHKENN